MGARPPLPPSLAFALAAALALVAVPRLGAQTLNPGTATYTLPRPTEADYDAGASRAATTDYTLTSSCGGNGSAGCTVRLDYGTTGSTGVTVEWRLISLTKTAGGASVSCTRGSTLAAPPTAFLPVNNAVVFTADKNATCAAAIQFRVSNLSYATYTTPSGSTTSYTRGLTFTLTRP